MLQFPYAFEAPLERHGVGKARKLWYHVLFLPVYLAATLPFDRHPQLRVEGEVAELPYEGAFISAGEGRWYCIVSPGLMREAGLALGSPVEMRFAIADQDRVDVPAALAAALSADEDAAAAWAALTTGRRRACA